MNTADYLLSSAYSGAVAIIDSEGAHTYGELRSGVAVRLAAIADLPPGSPVGIAGPNGFDWVAGYLAALAAGAVAVPVPTTLRPEEVVARLDWIGARAVFLGMREDAQWGGMLPIAVRRLVAPMGAPRSAPEAFISAQVNEADDAVYAFTSGTTGKPRAVRLTHQNLQANTGSIVQYLGLTSGERMLVVLPFSYVFGASLLHTHLRVGATLVIHPNVAFPQAIVQHLQSEQCTALAGVPSTFSVLLRNSTFGSRPVPQLRTIQQAGGRLAPALVDELVRSQPQARVFIMYGQTEATARLSFLPPSDLATRPGSIGRGIPGVELSVVSPDGREVVPGEIGEVCARGLSISPGYLNDPEESSRKMPDGRLHTGDLARVDEDGYIYIVDRQEDFIKSWGFRIASQDVEAAAIQLKELIGVAVVGVPDDAAGERVEMVAVRRPGACITEDEVLTHCRAHLSRQMVPARVHFVAQLPLNANGKVAKTALRELCARLGAVEMAGGDSDEKLA